MRECSKVDGAGELNWKGQPLYPKRSELDNKIND